MKVLLKIFIAFVFPVASFAGNKDTTIQGVKLESVYSSSIFPESWQGGSVNAEGEQISDYELKRVQPILIKALRKYPKDMLSADLRAVYVLKSMKFFNVGFGGTNSSDAVYITSDGVSAGYTDAYIEQTFHHEFSSILFRKHPSFLDTTAWKQQNNASFDYNDPENGVGAIKNKKSSQALDTDLAEKGMLTQYAMSSLENDINTFAQNLFVPESNFWEIVDRYPKINKKVKLLIVFYSKLSPVFTEQYFRAFAKNNN